jgi:penicillin-binding protein 1A
MSKKNKKKLLVKVLKYTLVLMVLAMLIVAGGALSVLANIIGGAPEFDPDKLIPSETSFVYDKTGANIVARLHSEQNRVYKKYNEIPDHLWQAFVSIEDERFFDHFGVDPKGTLKAVYITLRNRSLSGPGGSTITQQLIKNTFLTPAKTIERKVQEMWLAIQVERRYTKEQILEFYLNQIYFGHSAYGVQAAATVFFNKDVSELTIAESALIAGVTRSPQLFSPYINFDRSMDRQRVIISMMAKNGYITEEEAEEARNQEIVLSGVRSSYNNPYFVDHVTRETLQHLRNLGYSNEVAANMLYRGGLKIITTVNKKVQNKAEEIFENDKMFPRSSTDEKGLTQPQGAVSVIDQHTGEIIALVGGRGHEGRLSLNRATQSKRQPGSAIKPITVFTPAIEMGLKPSTVVDDSPIEVPLWDKSIWRPDNYNRRFRGLTNIRESVTWSINVPSVSIGLDLGLERMFTYGEKMGLKSLVPSGRVNDKQFAALTLGGLTFGVSPLELTTAYGTIANGGIYVEPYAVTKILDSNDRVLYQHRPVKEVVLREESAFFVTSMLQDVVTRGTGTNARFGWPAAGKTGTTDQRKDVWFVGYTPKYTASVWIGHDQPKVMDGAWGGTFAAPIWREIMKVAHEGLTVEQFTVPNNIIAVDICRISGKLPTDLCRQDPRGSQVYKEFFVRGTQPFEYCDTHVSLQINKENNKLATAYCPAHLVIFKTFINRPEFIVTQDGRRPADAQFAVPVEFCTDHLPWSRPPGGGSDSGGNDNNNGDNQNGNGNGNNNGNPGGNGNNSGNQGRNDNGNNQDDQES